MSNLASAFELVSSFDAGLFQIIGLSLFVSLSAVAWAALIGVPLGAVIALNAFPGRTFIIVVINALMGLPPVVAGLVRRGESINRQLAAAGLG